MKNRVLLQQEQLKTHLLLFLSFGIALIIRITVIGEYGLSEDEVVKALASQSYIKLNFSVNASHPALMKFLITISVLIIGETEFALRLPNVIISALTVYPIFYLGKELYNNETGVCASFLWAFHIPAISFSTTAKEDSLLTIFWVISIYFCIKAKYDLRYLRYSGITLGLALASKYTAVMLIGMLIIIHLVIQDKSVNLSSIQRFITLSIPPAMISFFVVNFPILFPDTIANVIKHYSPKTPEYTGWIMMGKLFEQRPPYYLLLHIIVKTPLPYLILLIIGLLYSIKYRFQADKILLLWITIPLSILSVLTYGYVRYYLVLVPAIVLLCAHGLFQFLAWLITRINESNIELSPGIIKTIPIIIIILVCFHSLFITTEVYPYYRMYVNEIGGSSEKSGYYFPQDSVYDYLLREAIQWVNEHAPPNSSIAIVSSVVGEYYGREDLQFTSIKDLPENIDQWDVYNMSYAIVQDSRVFYENQKQIENLRANRDVETVYKISHTNVAEVFALQTSFE